MSKTLTPNGIYEKEYSDNSNLYLIKLQSDSNQIQISIRDINDIEEISTYYKGNFSLDKLTGDNNILKKFDIENMKDILINVISTQKLSISKQNQTLITSWKFIIINEIDIKLILTKEKSDDKETIEQLINAVKNLNKENINLKNDVLNIKKDMEKLKNVLSNKILDESSIINNYIELININKWIIEKNEKNINKEIKLIYKATKDGDSASKYHELCDNKYPTITLIKTKKNRRFGHYMDQNVIIKQANYTKDEKAFLFSLDKIKKYDIKKPDYAMYYHTSYGPCFGYTCDIYLNDKFLSREDNPERNAKYYTYDVPSDTELTGESNFGVEEVEVYQIIY